LQANPWRRVEPHRSLGVYTEHGLAPGLVEEFLQAAKGAGCNSVYDPFVGSGVVAVAVQDAGLTFLGADANPWSLTLTTAKTRRLPWGRVREWASSVPARAQAVDPLVPTPRLARYHEPRELEALGRVRALIEEAPREWKPLLLAVHARVAEARSLLKRSPAPRFAHRPPRAGEPVEAEYTRLLLEAVDALERRSYAGSVSLAWADSTAFAPARVCGVLTSPPFANNIDYVRHTMLELLWAGYALDSHHLGALRSLQVPASEASARSWRQASEDKWIVELASRPRGPRARGYRRFLLQYFKAMSDHLAMIARALEWEAWYTIGDSVLGGAYIPVHEALARIAETHGLKATLKPIGPRARRGRTLYLLKLKP